MKEGGVHSRQKRREKKRKKNLSLAFYSRVERGEKESLLGDLRGEEIAASTRGVSFREIKSIEMY